MLGKLEQSKCSRAEATQRNTRPNRWKTISKLLKPRTVRRTTNGWIRHGSVRKGREGGKQRNVWYRRVEGAARFHDRFAQGSAEEAILKRVGNRDREESVATAEREPRRGRGGGYFGEGRGKNVQNVVTMAAEEGKEGTDGTSSTACTGLTGSIPTSTPSHLSVSLPFRRVSIRVLSSLPLCYFAFTARRKNHPFHNL